MERKGYVVTEDFYDYEERIDNSYVCVCLTEDSAKKEVERLNSKFIKEYNRYILLDKEFRTNQLTAEERPEDWEEYTTLGYEYYYWKGRESSMRPFGYEEIELID